MDHVEKLIALAGSERVSGYTRKSSTGKVVHVSSYTRDPGKMSNLDLFREFRTLGKAEAGGEKPSGLASPQAVSNRKAQVLTEIQKRQKEGRWHLRGGNANIAQRNEARKAVAPDAPDAPPAAQHQPPAQHAPDAPAQPAQAAQQPAAAAGDLSDWDAPAGKPKPGKQVDHPDLDKIMEAHGSVGQKDATGDLNDPIDVGGDVMKAAELLSQGKHVRLNSVDEVGTLLDELNRRVTEAKDAGENAPNIDLCKVSVPKTNLFCAESKGIPRAKMPQFGGQPMPGSKAADLPRNKRGEVNIEAYFEEELKARGIGIEEKDVPAAFLKASQDQLDGPKVAGMSRAMEQGLVPDAPIFVTKDGYIIDGHHRWASKVAIDARDGKLGDVQMPVRMIDMEIGEALDFANTFAAAMGIKPKGLGAAAEGVKADTGNLNKTAAEIAKKAAPKKQAVAKVRGRLGPKPPQFKDLPKKKTPSTKFPDKKPLPKGTFYRGPSSASSSNPAPRKKKSSPGTPKGTFYRGPKSASSSN